jgi:dynein heavy chain
MTARNPKSLHVLSLLLRNIYIPLEDEH